MQECRCCRFCCRGARFNPEAIKGLIQMLGRCPEIDVLILHAALNIGATARSPSGRSVDSLFVDSLIQGVKLAGKPAVLVIHRALYGPDLDLALQMMKRAYAAGVPVFRSVEGAARAIERFVRDGACPR